MTTTWPPRLGFWPGRSNCSREPRALRRGLVSGRARARSQARPGSPRADLYLRHATSPGRARVPSSWRFRASPRSHPKTYSTGACSAPTHGSPAKRLPRSIDMYRLIRSTAGPGSPWPRTIAEWARTIRPSRCWRCSRADDSAAVAVRAQIAIDRQDLESRPSDCSQRGQRRPSSRPAPRQTGTVETRRKGCLASLPYRIQVRP